MTEQRKANIGLIAASLLWGFSFVWAKSVGENVNLALGIGEHAVLGPILVLTWRFGAAGLLCLVLFPSVRRRWTVRSLRKAILLGVILWLGLVPQMLGLDRTSEAVSAFLTSLTIVFVPLILVFVLRKAPPRAVWCPVGIAVLGVWLLTGAAPTGFGLGETLGLCCAVLFSVYIIALNRLSGDEEPWAMAFGQFITVSLLSCALAAVICLSQGLPFFSIQSCVFDTRAIWQPLTLLILFPTICSFGLVFHLQPKIEPTQAALIYLFEPIFAAAFAFLLVGRTLSSIAIAGGVLILVANAAMDRIERRATAAGEAREAKETPKYCSTR